MDWPSLYELFRCASQGGMRASKWTNSLLIFLDPTHVHPASIYGDEWSEDEQLLYYRGSGQVGDQHPDQRANRWLTESAVRGVRVFCFETLEPGQHTFRGEMRLVGDPSFTKEPDRNGDLRQVCVFPLAFLKTGVKPASPLRPKTGVRPQTIASSLQATRAERHQAHLELEAVLRELGMGLGFDARPKATDPMTTSGTADMDGTLMPDSSPILAEMDVLWLTNDRLRAAFGVATPGTLETWLLRVADLAVLREVNSQCVFLVGAADLVERFRAAMLRPALAALPVDISRCFRYIDSAELVALYTACMPLIGSLSADSVLSIATGL